MFLAVPLALLAACGDDGGSGGTGGGTTTTSGSTSTGTSTGTGGPSMLTEKVLDVQLALTGVTLTITVKDGATPVATDAWLYTLTAGKLTPLTGFQDPDSKRKYRALLMPCKIAGAASKLVPCDAGDLNGVMTDAVRDTLANGAKKSAIDGIVKITLDAAPTDPVVVVVAREDERYAGAAAVGPDGKPATVPDGVGTPEAHVAVSYAKDIKPMIDMRCITCHAKGLVAGGYPLDSYDNILNNDFAHGEQIEDCNAATPGDQMAIDACIAAITKTEYMIEPGNPTLSTMMRRTRPDEEKSASATGLKWWGNKAGMRFDGTGDRRMPSLNTTPDTSDDVAGPTYYDDHPEAYQLLWDWVAQGAAK